VASPQVLLLQAVRALARHKARSSLNALGITIGVASVVWVIAIGEAGSARAQEQLHALGDNLVWVEAGARSVSGVRTGTLGMRNLMYEDGQAILRDVPEIRKMTPNVDGSVVVVSDTHNWTTHWRGVTPDYFSIKRWTMARGGSFSDEDVDRSTNVVVIGETVHQQLFGAADPLGETVRIAGQPFRVVGLLAPKGQSASGQDQDDTIVLPFTTAVKKLRGNGPLWLDDVLCSAQRPEDIAPAVQKIQALMRERHKIGAEQDDDFNIRHPEELIHAQMESHVWTKESGFEVQVSQGVTTLRENNYTRPAGEAPVNFRAPVDEKQFIRSILFGGFRKCLYQVQKFDSDPERRFAVILENDEAVEKVVQTGEVPVPNLLPPRAPGIPIRTGFRRGNQD